MPDEKDPKNESSDKLSDATLPPSDGSEPEIYALKREGPGWKLSRRTFLSATAIAAGAAACEKKKDAVIVQTMGPGGQWVTSVLEPGAPIPPGGVCVCNTVPAEPGSPNAPSVPSPTPFPSPTAPGGPQNPKSSPTPAPKPPPCTCVGVCSCVGYCSCQGVGHYWFPC